VIFHEKKAPRPTFDIDVIAESASYADYAAFAERLRGSAKTVAAL